MLSKIGRKDILYAISEHTKKKTECFKPDFFPISSSRNINNSFEISAKEVDHTANDKHAAIEVQRGALNKVSPKTGSSETCLMGSRSRRERHLAEQFSSAQSVSKINYTLNTVHNTTKSSQNMFKSKPGSEYLECSRLYTKDKEDYEKNTVPEAVEHNEVYEIIDNTETVTKLKRIYQLSSPKVKPKLSQN